jgi:hypothetical protein
LYYSGKKKRHTLKNVLIVDEFGSIHFLSDTYEGRVHDKCIADEAGYTLPNASMLYQDAGFQGFNLPGVQNYAAKEEAAQWNAHAAGKGGKPAYLICSRPN